MKDTLPLQFANTQFILDGRRALWWEAEQTLVVSDLHMGKGASFAPRGSLLPPYDIADTLARLETLLDAYRPKHVLCLGDSFHRKDSLKALSHEERMQLHNCVAGVEEWIWIAGNHDPHPPEELGGYVVSHWERQGIVFRHEPEKGAAKTPTVIGHFHPKANWMLHRRRVSYPCFAWNERLLVMPAFGTFTGGLEVREAVLQKLLGAQAKLACIGHNCQLIEATNA